MTITKASGSSDIVADDLTYICGALQDEFQRMAGKHILITGGAGFLGHYLVQSLLEWNHQARGRAIRVTVYDNFLRGAPAWLLQRRDDPHLVLERRDAANKDMDPNAGFDYILHAASIASPTYYRQYPIETMDANVQGLRRILDYCRLRQAAGSPVAGVLFFSTSEIYGDPPAEHIPTPETYRGYVSCTGPRACYDESKRYGETLCVNFAKTYGVPVKIVRPFNNYGPGLGLDDRRVIPDFCRDVLAGKDIEILSDGTPTRTYCYVADAIVGYYKVLTWGRCGEAYNVGVERPEVSITELAGLIAAAARELLGYSGTVVRTVSGDPEYLTDNPMRRCPVIDKCRSECGFEPRISLEAGLTRSLLWYREQLKAREAEA